MKAQTISQGEDSARKHLVSLKLNFIHDTPKFFSEYPRLRPDFVLSDLNTIIEIDGSDHFPHRTKTRIKKSLQSNDIYKDKWCLENGWHMVRIPYLNTHVAKTIPGLIDAVLTGIRDNPKHLYTPIGTDYYERPHPCPRQRPDPSSMTGV